MFILIGVSEIQLVLGLCALGFWGAALGAVTGIIGKAKAGKASAKLAKDMADKEKVLQLRLSQNAAEAAVKKQSFMLKIAMIAGMVIVFIVIMSIGRKKKR